MISLGATLDTSGLSAGLAEAAKYTSRTLPELVNTSAYWIAINAQDLTPKVDIGKIDEELATLVLPVLGKRGKPKKNEKRYFGGISAIQHNRTVPLVILIIQARANPASRYNALTHSVYAQSSPFKGKTRAEGAAAMAQAIHGLIAKRHSSIAFLKAGWVEVIKALKPFAVQKWGRGRARPDLKSLHGGDKGFGRAVPARPGLEVVAVIENNLGAIGKNAENVNRALIEHGLPALQAAVNREGIEKMEYAAKKMEQELAQKVNSHWS